mgnify:CR=1 FL=1|jgi:organic hydroperoxide reductase OsmC/OhrA
MEENFKTFLRWHSLGKPFSYKEYSRLYTIGSEGKPDLVGTAAPSYSGSNYHYNPEEMLIMSLASCHMLSYLAYAANSDIKVLSYQDDAGGSLTKEGHKISFKEVILKPKVLISEDSNVEKAVELHHKAHEACFIANSVNFPVKISPEIIAGEIHLNSVA